MANYETYIRPEPVRRTNPRMAAGDRMIVRAFQRLGGVSLIVAALALWLMPGSNWAADLMLFKLVLSVSGVLAGTGLLLASCRMGAPFVELDPKQGAVRVLRPRPGQAPIELQSCAFADLSLVERRGPFVRLWDADQRFLAEVTLEDKDTLVPVLAGLRAAGKVV